MRHDDAIIVIVFDVVEETHTVGGREILFRSVEDEENLEVLRQQGKNVSRAMLKGLEKRKHNLVAKLSCRTGHAT